MKRFFIRLVKGLLILVFSWILFHQSLSAWQRHEQRPSGKFVTVYNKPMHVVEKGKQHKTTIVLLSGLATPAPSRDFMPLMNELSKSYHVVTVEPFGYGYSADTKRPRTMEAIVEDYRAALQQADIRPPYVLMPHSIAGLYSLAYASRYPKEVKAIVGLDSSVPQQTRNAVPLPKWVYDVVRELGIVRLATWFNPSVDIESDRLLSRQAFSTSVVREMAAVPQSLATARTLEIPASIPCLYMIASETVAVREMKWKRWHEQLAARQQRGEVVELKGSHYIHHDALSAIVRETKRFIGE